jgi:hypothetical protein
VHFRLTYEITEYSITLREGPLVIRIGGPHNLSVALTPETDDYNAPSKTALLQALAEAEPPPKAALALRNMILAKTNSEPEAKAGDQQLQRPSYPQRFDELSGSLKEFSSALYSELADAAVRAFEVIRWRCAMPGPVRPYRSLGFEFSEDQNVWYRLPHKITLRIKAGVPRGPIDSAELESMISSGAQEPLSHALLREAWASMTITRGYSSALIIGMAALEIGAKHLIAELIPGARWLALQMPAPPIDRILTDFLPTLPARLLANGKVITPPKELIDAIKKGVTARNMAVHAGTTELDREFVERVLDAVSEILWILDFYAGNKWAVNYLSSETKAALTRID